MSSRRTILRVLYLLLFTGVPIAAFTFRGYSCRWRAPVAVSFLKSHGNGYVSFNKGTGPSDNNDNEDNSENKNTENINPTNHSGNDSFFYRDLQQAKTSKLGANIPQEQLQALTDQAESEFLQAMKETQEEFQCIKEEMGSDAAVEMLLDRMRKEEEKNDYNTSDKISSFSTFKDGDLLGEFE
jgi:hypothetical protein